MNLTDAARRALLTINALGLIIYLYWLATRSERLFAQAEGALYILPCLLFLFVFLYLRHGETRREDDDEPSAF